MAEYDEREAEVRRKLAQETFHEVLDSIKHHDDKIGRFITWISFLTAGAIAFGFRSEVLVIRYEIGSSEVPAICFTAFLLLVLLGVLLLVVGLGPDIELPTGPKSSSLRGSRLYFLFIARETPSGWKARWDDVPLEDLMRELTRDYLQESWQLAEKTDFKHLRTSEARAVLSLAVLSLALGLVLAINRLARVQIGAVEWSLRPQLLAALVIGVFVLVLGYDLYRLEQSVGTVLGFRRSRELRKLVGAIVLLALFPSVVLTPGGVLSPRGLALTVALVAWLLWGRYKSRLASWVLTGLVVLLALGALVTVFVTSREWDLALACGPAVIIALPRLLASVETWCERRQEADKVKEVLGAHLRTLPGAGDPMRALEARGAGRRPVPSTKPTIVTAIHEFERATNIGRAAWLEAGVSADLLDQAGVEPPGAGTGPDAGPDGGSR